MEHFKTLSSQSSHSVGRGGWVGYKTFILNFSALSPKFSIFSRVQYAIEAVPTI